MIFAFVNLKGGVGKSELCQNIAAALTRGAGKAVIVDLDPQASTVDWFRRRQQGGNPRNLSPITVRQLRRLPSRADAETLAREYTHVLFDAAAQNRNIARAAVEASDVVVVPFPPYPADFDGTLRTVELHQNAAAEILNIGALAIVPNRVQAGVKIAQTILEHVRVQWQGLVVPCIIRHRIAFPVASQLGRTVIETEGKGEAADDIMKVTKALKTWRD